MEISQDINYQKHNFDPSPLATPLPEKETAVPPGTANETPSDTAPGSSLVSLSEKGRAASQTFDFHAEAETLSRLEALGSSKSFANAHAAISYDKVKHLLE